jgi:predicted porin
MNKTILAFALLGGSSVSALAQNTATQPADAGVAPQSVCQSCPVQDGSAAVPVPRAGSAGANAAKEKTPIFTHELGTPAETPLSDAERANQAGHLLGRQGYVGLAGDFGALMLGRQFSLDHLAVSNGTDASGIGMGGAGAALGGGVRRVDSDEQFYSATSNGVAARAAFGVDRFDGSAARRAWGLSLGFDVGPVTISAAHQNRHVANINLYDKAGNNLDARNSLLAASFRLDWGKAYAAYSVNRGWGSSPLFNPDNPYAAGVASMPSTDSRDVLVGVAIPLRGSFTLLASAIHKDDRDLANRDANQFAIGASYTLSRRTDFYAAYSRIHGMGSAGTPVGYTNGTSAINIGMRHSF